MLRFPNKPLWLGIGSRAVGGITPGVAGMDGIVPLCDAAQPGEAVLAALEAWFAEHRPRRRTVHAVVSDRYLRYAHLPWHEDVLDAGEDAILCRARLAAVHGDMAGWLVQADKRRFMRGRIACAMPDWLAEGLAMLAARHGARVGSLLPQFAACWNRWRARAGRTDGMLALVDDSHLMLATFGPGGWQGLRSQFLLAHPQALDVAVRREKLRLALPDGLPVWVADFAGGMPQALAHG